MFDDPKKELRRLQEQLLAAEEEQWETPEEVYESEEEEPEEEEPEVTGGRFLREAPGEIEEEPEEVPSEGRSHIPALVAALLLEVAALFGVLAWWLLWK